MIDQGRHSILGIRVNAIDYDAATDRIVRAARDRQPMTVSALAVHGVMTGVLDRTHRHRLNDIDLIVPDGQPVRWALNWLYRTTLPDRVYGPRLMLEICRRAADEEIPMFLFGCDEPTLLALRQQLCQMFPALRIVGTRSSRFRTLSDEERQELIADIHTSCAQMAFVGIGCPRQEVFVYELRNELPMPLIAVGAAFAFHACQLPQAPLWMQRAGMEWLFRLAMEPKRLWRRYLFLNPLYLSLLALQRLRIYRIDPDDTELPTQRIRYG